MANTKLLTCENLAVAVVCIQMGALKTLTTLLSCSQYSELLLVPLSSFSLPVKKDLKVTIHIHNLCVMKETLADGLN